MSAVCPLVVLASSVGTNLQAILNAIAAGEINANVRAVISDKPQAFALERARSAGIAAEVLDPRAHATREAYDTALAALIDQHVDQHTPGLVVLAGFLRILTPAFVQHYAGRLLNIHPSLLPKYRGLHTHRRVLEAGDVEHGASVHFVTEELDGGPLVLQESLPVVPGDTEASLAARVQQLEHRIYPRAIGWFASGRLRLQDQSVMLDGKPLQNAKQKNF